MRAFFITALTLFVFSSAKAQSTEKEIYWCKSSVSGFESFRILQKTETVEGQAKITYSLKTGIFFFEDVWQQYGDAKVSQASPVFESEFTKEAVPPTPLLPLDPPPPTPQVDEYFLAVSINQFGSGSLSVDGDLAPIECTPSDQ